MIEQVSVLARLDRAIEDAELRDYVVEEIRLTRADRRAVRDEVIANTSWYGQPRTFGVMVAEYKNIPIVAADRSALILWKGLGG